MHSLVLVHHLALGPLFGDPVLHLLLGRLDLRRQLVLLGEFDEQAVDLPQRLARVGQGKNSRRGTTRAAGDGRQRSLPRDEEGVALTNPM